MDEITEEKARQMYNDYLDDLGLENLTSTLPDASVVLKRCDEIAYNCGFNDFVDALQTDEATDVIFD